VGRWRIDDHPPSRRALYADSGTTYYATVQKLLERLERKTASAATHREPATFAAAVTRSELIGRRLQAVADRCAADR
jgi:hypothetical protein